MYSFNNHLQINTNLHWLLSVVRIWGWEGGVSFDSLQRYLIIHGKRPPSPPPNWS